MLRSQSVALELTAFSPVRTVWDRHSREPTQHERNGCARNLYMPRVFSDRVAYTTKRCSTWQRFVRLPEWKVCSRRRTHAGDGHIPTLVDPRVRVLVLSAGDGGS